MKMLTDLKKILRLTGKSKGTGYLVEFRLTGKTKIHIKDLIFKIAKKFKVTGRTKKHVVPHVTLFGPFTCNKEKELLLQFSKICKKHKTMKYQISNFGNFEKRVIHVEIKPSKELQSFRHDLAESLIEIANSVQKHDYDNKEDYKFHATLAFRDIEKKFNNIKKYLENIELIKKDEYVLRITLLKKGKILREYDTMQKKMLTRNEALSRQSWKKTFSILNSSSKP